MKILLSKERLRAWQRGRLGIRRASLRDCSVVVATVTTLLEDVGLSACAEVGVVYDKGGFTVCLAGEGDGFDAACEAVSQSFGLCPPGESQ